MPERHRGGGTFGLLERTGYLLASARGLHSSSLPPVSTQLPPRPADATLSVTKAARLLGVHPNTVRAWSDAGRLRYYRINPRGDRRYRVGDLQRFLAAAEHGNPDGAAGPPVRRQVDLASVALAVSAGRGGAGDARDGATQAPADAAHAGNHREALALLDLIARVTLGSEDLDEDLGRVARAIRDSTDLALTAIWEVRGDRLRPVATAAAAPLLVPRLLDLPASFGVLGRALGAAPARTGARDHDAAPSVAIVARPNERVTVTVLPGERSEVAVAIPGRDGPWGVLLLLARSRSSLPTRPIQLADTRMPSMRRLRPHSIR